MDGKHLLGHKTRIGHESRMTRALLVRVQRECFVGATRRPTYIVQDIEDARSSLGMDQIQNILVLGEIDEGPWDSLAIVFFLLVAQDESVELLLQRLVAKVDA
jgi:hypothetical protein